jgi:hypothetical protein
MIIKTPNSVDSPSVSRFSLTVDVPRQVSFRIEPGRYRAAISGLRPKERQNNRSSTPFVRILLSVTVPNNTKFDYIAKYDLKKDMNEGSDLWNVLCRLIGRKRLEDCSGSSFDLNSLIGTECDIEIGHVCDHSDNYDYPLVVVTDIQASGRLVQTDEVEH